MSSATEVGYLYKLILLACLVKLNLTLFKLDVGGGWENFHYYTLYL